MSSYLPFSSIMQNNSKYESFRDRNYLLEKENEKLNWRIQEDLRNHLIQSSLKVPCPLKKGYETLLADTFCRKPSQRVLSSNCFTMNRSAHLI